MAPALSGDRVTKYSGGELPALERASMRYRFCGRSNCRSRSAHFGMVRCLSYSRFNISSIVTMSTNPEQP